jgi:hypothetical protein
MIGNSYTGDVSALSEIAENIEVDPNSNWVDGDMIRSPHLHFQAKVFREGSSFGINGGRISKLNVYKKKDGFVEKSYYEYDRGLNEEKETPDAVQSFVDRMVRILG